MNPLTREEELTVLIGVAEDTDGEGKREERMKEEEGGVEEFKVYVRGRARWAARLQVRRGYAT